MSLRDGLKDIYRAHDTQLYACALAITRCPEAARDAVHDAFCRLLRQDTPPRSLKVYVFRSVRNAAIDLHRKRTRRAEDQEVDIFDEAPSPADNAENGEFKGRVAAALRILSDDEQETVVEHLYGGLTFKEIAQLRGKSQNTVKSWYRRGLEKLRRELEVEQP